MVSVKRIAGQIIFKETEEDYKFDRFMVQIGPVSSRKITYLRIGQVRSNRMQIKVWVRFWFIKNEFFSSVRFELIRKKLFFSNHTLRMRNGGGFE